MFGFVLAAVHQEDYGRKVRVEGRLPVGGPGKWPAYLLLEEGRAQGEW